MKSTKTMIITAMFAAVIAVLAQIAFPLPSGVPVTLQTFAVALTGVVLGAKLGTISTFIYILLGAVGVPVFSGLNGGLGFEGLDLGGGSAKGEAYDHAGDGGCPGQLLGQYGGPDGVGADGSEAVLLGLGAEAADVSL